MFGGSAENEATAIHSFTYSSRRSPDSSAAPDQNNLFWLRGGLVAVARGRTVGISRLVVVLFNLPFLDHSPFCTVRFVSRLRSIRCPMMIWRWNNTQTETGGKGRTERERWSDSKGGDRPPSTDHTRAVNNGVEMTYCEPHTEWRKMWFALASELLLVFFASQIHWEFMYNTGREMALSVKSPVVRFAPKCDDSKASQIRTDILIAFHSCAQLFYAWFE